MQRSICCGYDISNPEHMRERPDFTAKVEPNPTMFYEGCLMLFADLSAKPASWRPSTNENDAPQKGGVHIKAQVESKIPRNFGGRLWGDAAVDLDSHLAWIPDHHAGIVLLRLSYRLGRWVCLENPKEEFWRDWELTICTRNIVRPDPCGSKKGYPRPVAPWWVIFWAKAMKTCF